MVFYWHLNQSIIMENNILGIHHITAIAGNAKRNFDFQWDPYEETTISGL